MPLNKPLASLYWLQVFRLKNFVKQQQPLVLFIVHKELSP